MKMNSNNEQDYRHFKGVGASYESGVVYSHQKLVVSEVQTKTRKYNAARLMRHIGHHFPGGFKITNRTAEGILPFYVLRCESGWTENWTVIDASDTTLATNARNQLVCTAHKVPAADGRVRVHPDSMKRFMATLTDMVAQRDVEITSLPFDVVVYNEIMWERKGGDGATGVPHQDNPGELGEKGTAGDGETRLPNSTVLDQEYDPEEGFDILNRTMWKERKMQTLTDVISLLENSGHLTGWGIRNSRIRGIDFCAWVLFKDVKEVDRLIYRHMKLFDTTELVLGGTLQGAGWRSRNYVENFVFNGKQVCVTLACNGASIAALAVLSQMRRLMYNQMRRLMYNTETRTQIIDSILETHLEDADDETPRVKPPKKSLPAQDAGDYEGN